MQVCQNTTASNSEPNYHSYWSWSTFNSVNTSHTGGVQLQVPKAEATPVPQSLTAAAAAAAAAWSMQIASSQGAASSAPSPLLAQNPRNVAKSK